ncbi:germ cell nuclear acidic protein [Paramormyrops kingsleyae]|uniref:Germ cell nuclear acidic peptidase n=1 Tax=Paramormyrops kingsleyae TaxID=1676925 RepID=A0A3B3SXY6_9TELE|nr:acidic repeat-containing protein [Paramormyrops kingsleyae]XP_023667262.1 acidic repeat-containing protein [Paramormyrops kingsleyae]XP_023667263.1 acidic repeat-containing protein [Paramormyrops kingsleyae]XP_023667264.1 acidic repeat-containing protein [Paramormyrops kingsleyae]
MDASTDRLFQKVAEKLGWTAKGALDLAEKELIKNIGKSRHQGPSRAVDSDNGSSGKENSPLKGQTRQMAIPLDSSDDDFDVFLVARATPAARRPPEKNTACEESPPALVVSSDTDDSFEKFLSRVKTPKTKPARVKKYGSDDSLKQFIMDSSSDEDFVTEQRKKKPLSKGNPRAPSPGLRAPPAEPCPVTQLQSPVFVSDDDEGVLIKSTWKSRHTRLVPTSLETKSPAPESLAPPSSSLYRTPIQLEDSSSGEEFQSLLERLKKNHSIGSTNNTQTPKPSKEPVQKPSLSVPRGRGPKPSEGRAGKARVEKPTHSLSTPVQTVERPVLSQTEPRLLGSSRSTACKTPGCFLQSLSIPGSQYCRSFKQHKEELTGRLYQLYNSSIFEGKLPSNMSVSWNKKMRKTAGYCISGQERGSGNRYARIELSEKVCDSADRLRDTLVHEMCHAATWIINGVRDGHGSFWKLYARKATLAHPELPMVTRCHSYDINYKFQYQCSRCKNVIGRHSKSLDTQRFVCALCTGQLVLLTPAKSRGPTPFAAFVKENYGNVRQELGGKGHAEVMRKLSADFAAKTQLGSS